MLGVLSVEHVSPSYYVILLQHCLHTFSNRNPRATPSSSVSASSLDRLCPASGVAIVKVGPAFTMCTSTLSLTASGPAEGSTKVDDGVEIGAGVPPSRSQRRYQRADPALMKDCPWE